jgi:hypothetical protein
VSTLPLLLPQKQTHQKKKKKREFCASIIAATKWLWSAAIALAVAIPVIAALVAVNRRMTRWMKCSSGWMDHGTALGEASFNISSSFTIYNVHLLP